MANETKPNAVTCTINGKPVTVAPGTRIIEAAEQAGVGIPHYCYHPGLSAPAMCRMCLVEVEGAPKLAPACVTAVGEGQVIQTESPKARESRQGVLEFYLANHPLDCPICDQSGECKLQDYVAAEGRKHGRFLEQKRVFGRDDFGGDVLYYGDRCIMCTRCVRFMREIAQDDLLCVVQRGHRSVIDTFFEEGLGGNLWAGNVVDICPVGALVSKDFLHKARAWDLDRVPSICPNCSQGCNIRIESRDNLAMRFKPRANPAVNSYWMCDYGRQRYEWLNRGRGREGAAVAWAAGEAGGAARVDAPLARNAEGALVPMSWHDVIVALVDRLKSLGASRTVDLVASPMRSNEDAALALRLGERLGTPRPVYRGRRAADEESCPGFPKLARRRDLEANVRGLDALGFRRVGDDEGRGGLEQAAAASDGVVLVIGDELADQTEQFGSGAGLYLYLGDTLSQAARNADFVLPLTTFAEQEGTFTNHERRVQRFWPALQPPLAARPAWQILGVVLAGLDDGPAPASAADAFLRLTQLHEPFAGLSYELLGSRGAVLNEPIRVGAGSPEAV
jgi:NADH-quinone oxidoreductase subunit G